MKKKARDKELIILIITIPIVLLIAFWLSNGSQLPPYSVQNKTAYGYSVFYEAMKELKVPTDTVLSGVEAQDVNSIQIVSANEQFDVNADEVKGWVSRGGTLVYLTDVSEPIDYGSKPVSEQNFVIYDYDKGKVICADITSVTNKTLVKNKQAAYELFSLISANSDKKVYFNESYIYGNNSKSFWDYIPREIKFVIYQVLIALAVVFYYKGKRFGKPIPLYEEEERIENEYLYSAAALYKQAKCWDIMLENYYKSFLRHMRCSSEEWLDFWQREKLPHYKKAQELYEFMNNLNLGDSRDKNKSNDYTQIVNLIEQLDNIYMKRREEYWKTLKKI